MRLGRAMRYAALTCGVLALAPALSTAQESRSRTLFNPGADKARNLVLTLDPVETPPAGSEVSVYLPVRFAHDSDRPVGHGAAEPGDHFGSDIWHRNSPDVLFTVEGHTDASGAASYNEDAVAAGGRDRRRCTTWCALGVPRSASLPSRPVSAKTDLLPGVDPLSAEQRRVEFVRRF